MRVVAAAGSWTGDVNLAPIRVGLVPEDSSPGFVQSIQSIVLFPEPDAECRGIALGIKFTFLTIDLVVYLPADNSGMRTVMGCG